MTGPDFCAGDATKPLPRWRVVVVYGSALFGELFLWRLKVYAEYPRRVFVPKT